MSNWKLIKTYRKNVADTVRADQTIYLPNYTGGAHWENPKCFATYKIAICNGEEIDLSVTPVISGQSISFNLGQYMNKGASYINFYAWEGDF